MTVNRPRTGIQSLHRAFDIIELVATSGTINASQIARELDLPVSTVNNLARTLASRGYLLGRRGTYELGPGVTWLTSRWDAATALPSLVVPHLEQISMHTGQSASATVLVGDQARLIGFTPGNSAVTVQQPRWVWESPLDIATGTVLAAFDDSHAWADPAMSPLTAPQWEAQRARIHETGVHARQSSGPTGQTSFAVPVWTLAGPACSIGTAAPTFVVTDDTLRTMVASTLEASRALSAQLGHESPLPTPGEVATAVQIDLAEWSA